MTKEEIEEAKRLLEAIRNFQLDEEIEKVKEESECETNDMEVVNEVSEIVIDDMAAIGLLDS